MDKKSQANALLDRLSRVREGMVKPTGLRHYRPEPTDLIIATYPKAGTTLLQNLTYQVVVATGGAPPFDLDGLAFEDINQVAPWLDFGPEFGVMEAPTNPRIFKTHSCADQFNLDKSRYIVCVRDPLKYPASFLDFLLEPLLGENVTDDELKREIFDELVSRYLLGLPPSNASSETAFRRYGLWFDHVKNWLFPSRRNVLVLFYEDVVADVGATARRVAGFMGRSLSDEAVQTVAQRCDRQTMAADSKFRSQSTRYGLGIGNAELVYCFPEKRKGFTEFSLRDKHVEAVHMKIQETFGVSDYQALRELVNGREDASADALPTDIL